MSRIRSAVGRRVRRVAGHADLEKRLARLETRLTKQEERLRRQKERLDEVRPRRILSVMEILATQVAALEERVADLAEQVERPDYAATDDERAQARRLVDEVREEHRRIRVRFGAVTRYEERLRRLEAALAEEMAAAAQLARDAAEHGVLADAPTHGAVDPPDEHATGLRRDG